jgi:hypothetical protein
MGLVWGMAMNLRRATFGELFGTAFVVGLAFQAAFFILGLLMALTNPGAFHAGPPGEQLPATNPIQAFAILIMLTICLIIANLVVSSAGAGLLVVARSLGWFEKWMKQ